MHRTFGTRKALLRPPWYYRVLSSFISLLGLVLALSALAAGGLAVGAVMLVLGVLLLTIGLASVTAVLRVGTEDFEYRYCYFVNECGSMS